MSKVWFITGAGSGIGARAAKAALKAEDEFDQWQLLIILETIHEDV